MMQDGQHGGALDLMRAAFPSAPEPWIDLSTGINPWSYPFRDIPDAAYRHLPVRDAYDSCRSAMAKALRAPAESLLLAPGSELLIRLLPKVINPRRAAILTPMYGDHVEAWRRARCDIIETEDPLGLADQVDAVVVCNPNNPDGRRFAPDSLLRTAERLARRGGWLIVDEAYADLDPSLSLAPHGGKDGLIVLRSFGKFYGLAGVRLGALLAPEALRSEMQHLLGVWPVSGPALHIGKQACRDEAWQREMRSRLADARVRLDRILHAAGLKVVGGTDLFRLVETENATRLWEHLAHHGIYVRRFDWSDRLVRIGLPETDAAETRLSAGLTP